MTAKAHGKTASFIRELILGDIRQGVILPSDRLSTSELAERYKVSRTPVREALIALQQEGFVAATANSGFRMRRVDLDELCQIYELREALEGIAAEKLARRGAPSKVVAELRECCELQRAAAGLTFLEIVDADRRFHQAICNACGSEMLRELLNSRLIMAYTFRSSIDLLYPAFEPVNTGRVPTEHEAIVRAIEKGHARTAQRLMRLHVAHARKLLENRKKAVQAADKSAAAAARNGRRRAAAMTPGAEV